MATEYIPEWIDSEKAVVVSAIVDGEYTGARIVASRIQRQRTKGWRMPEGAVYVGRPTRWGNPFRVGSIGGPRTHAEAAHTFRLLVSHWVPENLEPLRGRDLACWCPLDRPCHADVLLELANR